MLSKYFNGAGKECKERLIKSRVNADTSTAIATFGAITTWFFSCNPAMNDGTRTANTSIYTQSCNRTITNTGPTLHTVVKFNDPGQTFFDNEHRVRANRCAEGTADTSVLIQFEGRDPLEVFVPRHIQS